MDRLSATSHTFDTPRLIASMSLGLGGLVLASMWMLLSIDPVFLIGLCVGLIAALTIQWAQVLWFTANVKRTEHLQWIKRLPPSLAAFKRPLRAMLSEMDEREAAIAEAVSREQMRSVEAETLRSKVQSLETALSETRNDMMDVLDGLRTLEGSYQDATIGRIARLASLRSSLQGPVVVTQLAELVAEVATTRSSIRNRVVLSGPLPAVTCPTQVIETLLDELLAELAELSDGPIEVTGQSDGGMAVMTFTSGEMPMAVSPDVSIAQRAARLLGGDVWISADRSVVVAVPRRYEPGLEALGAAAAPRGLTELF
jgi:hypothetical protein